MSDSESSPFGPVIYAYTRSQALADGVLVDFSDLAREAGFRVPLAVTEAVYKEYLDPSQALVDEGQSRKGRVWDLLQVLHFAAAVSPDRDTVYFKVLFVLTPGCPPEPIELKAICGPGDDGSPVLTVLLPNED
jgi:hypothetical protein